jgi:uncharacterized damage-inducible protein DinB
MKANELFAHWEQVRSELLTLLDGFNDDELNYAPYERSWSVGQIALHIANAEDGWFRFVIQREMSEWPKDYTLENYPSMDAIQAVLRQSHVRTLEYLAGLEAGDLQQHVESPWGASFTLNWIIWHVIEHEIHHRGELSLILGLLGREGLDI